MNLNRINKESRFLDFRQTLRTLAAISAFAFALIVFQQIAFSFRFPPLERTAVWTPGAIVLAVLWIAPIRDWWKYYVGICIAAVVAFWFDPLIGPTSAFVKAHCVILSAMTGALILRRYGKEPLLQCPRSLIVFLPVAVVLIPCLTHLPSHSVGEFPQVSEDGSYWKTLTIVSLSHSIGYLIGTPLLLLAYLNWKRWIASPNRSSVAEFIVLVAVLLVVNQLVFRWSPSSSLIVSPLLYMPLLFLLWAAMRFGVAGVSLCLLLIAYQSTWGAIHGRGPFVSSVPADNVLQLQLYVMAFAIPLLFLSATVQERERAFQSLEREVEGRLLAENRFRTVVEFAPTAIVMVDSRGQIRLLNSFAERTFGYRRSELLDRPIETLFPEIRSVLNPDPLSDRLESSAEPSRTFRTTGRQLGGKELPVEIALTYLVNQEGRFALLAIDDITERNRLAAFRDELAHSSRLLTLGGLTTSIAHEINQPLGAILSNSEAAEMVLESPQPPLGLLRRIVADIRRDNIRASEVIKRMRSFMRRGRMEIEPIDIAVLIKEVAEFVRSEARSQRVVLTTVLTPDLPLVMGNRVHLQQVLLNLLVNGIEAMVDIEGEHKLTVAATAGENGYVEIAVADNGRGISDDRFAKLFEQFESSKPNGLGLGLVISKSLVEGQGGQISAENSPSGGAVFRVKFAAYQPDGEPSIGVDEPLAVKSSRL